MNDILTEDPMPASKKLRQTETTLPSQPSQPTVRLVVARYKEKLDWLGAIPPDYEIYISNSGDSSTLEIPSSVKSRVKVVHTPNVGREAGHWLRYIVDHYDSLADINVFLQGAPYVGHTPDILFRLERSDLEVAPFKYLCTPATPTRFLVDGTGFTPRALIAIAVARKYPVVALASGGVWGGQHQATREIIHNNPKEWYEIILSKAAIDKFANTLEPAWNVVYSVPPDILPTQPAEKKTGLQPSV
jgi:hypothetical protein